MGRFWRTVGTVAVNAAAMLPAAIHPEDSEDEPSEPERGQTASAPAEPEAPAPEREPPSTDDDDEGGGFLGGLGNLVRLGRIGDGLGRGFGGSDNASGEAAGGGN